MSTVTELLESINNNLKPKNTSYSFTVSWTSTTEGGQNTARYTQDFAGPIDLDSTEYEIAVISLETYFSFPNITDGVNNVFAYKSTPGGNSTLLSLPTGSYGIVDISSEINRQVGDVVYSNMTLTPNDATLKAVFKLDPNYRIDFTVNNSIREILGFNNEIVGGQPGVKYYSGDNIVNILNVNTVLVNCDLVTNSYNNGVVAPTIYSFFPDVKPGFKIVRNVENPIYLRVNKRKIDSISVWLTDQNNKLLNFRGETISIRFHLRNIR